MSAPTKDAEAVYDAVASAWNDAADASTGIQWLPLAALAGGAISAVLCILVYKATVTPLGKCLARSSCFLQCPVVVVVAPEPEMRPYLQQHGGGRSKSSFAVQRQRGVPPPRATVSQWNKMRAALGPKVPDKHVYELLQKHGDDVRGASDDFYGPGGY